MLTQDTPKKVYEKKLTSEINDIYDLLHSRKLFSNEEKLDKTWKLIQAFEAKYSNHLPAVIELKLKAIKEEYRKCIKTKESISHLCKDLEEERDQKIRKQFGGLPYFYRIESTSYDNGIAKVYVLETKWTAPDAGSAYDESTSEEKTMPPKNFFHGESLSNDQADDIQEKNEQVIRNELNVVNDLLSDDISDYEQANKKLAKIEQNYNVIISLENKFNLIDLKEKSKNVEVEMLSLKGKVEDVATKVADVAKKVGTMKTFLNDFREESKTNHKNTRTLVTTKSSDIINKMKEFDAVSKRNQDQIKQRMTDLSQQAKDIKAQQARHTQELQTLNKKADDIKNQLSEANNKLSEIKNQQVQHKQSLQDLSKQSAEIKKQLNDSFIKLNEIQQQQGQQKQVLLGLDKKADELQARQIESNKKLSNILKEQSEQKGVLISLEKMADKIKSELNDSHVKLNEIKLQQDQEKQVLLELDKKAKEIKAGQDDSNMKLGNIIQEQNQHKQVLLGLDKKADELKVAELEANKKLSHVIKEQGQQKQVLLGLDKKADEIKRGQNETNVKLTDVRKEQEHQKQVLMGLDKKSDELKAGQDEANQKLNVVKLNQDLHTKKLDEISQQEIQLQMDVNKANQSLEEVKKAERNHAITLENQIMGLNAITKKVHEDFNKELSGHFKNKKEYMATINLDIHAQIEQLSTQVRLRNNVMMADIKSYYSKAAQCYLTLADDFKRKKDMRDTLFIKVKNEYDEQLQMLKNKQSIESELEKLDDLYTILDKMTTSNREADNNDIERMNHYYETVIKASFNELSSVHENIVKTKKEAIDKIANYQFCEKISDMPEVTSSHLATLYSFHKPYTLNINNDIKLAAKALNDEINYIFKLADLKNRISNDIKEKLNQMIAKREELQFKMAVLESTQRIQHSYIVEKDILTYEILKLEGFNYYQEAEKFKAEAQIYFENKDYRSSTKQFNGAIVNYRLALEKFHLAQKNKNDIHESEFIIKRINENMNDIDIIQEKLSRINEVMTLFSQSNKKDKVTDLSVIDQQEKFTHANTRRSL